MITVSIPLAAIPMLNPSDSFSNFQLYCGGRHLLPWIALQSIVRATTNAATLASAFHTAKATIVGE
jgi:hypothetical protein